MLKIDPAEIEALAEVTEQFLHFADNLLTQGEISQEEHNSMTGLKRKFLEDMRSRYF